MIGFLCLFVFAALGHVLLLRHIRQLRRDNARLVGEAWDAKAAFMVARDRISELEQRYAVNGRARSNVVAIEGRRGAGRCPAPSRFAQGPRTSAGTAIANRHGA